MASVVALSLATSTFAATATAVTVFAAASLKESLDDAAKQFEAVSGHKVVVSYAASSALARQIISGAPADIFFSADTEWMDYLIGKKLMRAASRVDLLSNRLVLIAPVASNVSLRIAPKFALRAAVGNRRLAIADPKFVPAGKYAKSALESLGVWHDIENNIAPAENVRAAMSFVARGEAPLGIVYATDALAEKRVRVVDTFPMTSHSLIIYPLALTVRESGSAAQQFIDYLKAPTTRMLWARYGFQVR
jgi:molybdate transport system substrate-binding protein